MSPTNRHPLNEYRNSIFVFSSPEQRSWRAIVLHSAAAASALALASASTNVLKFSLKF